MSGIKLLLLLIFVFALAGPALAQSQKEKEKDVHSYTLSPEKYQQAIQYARARYVMYFVGTAYGLLLLWWIITWKVGARYRDFAEALSKRRFLQSLVITSLLVFTIGILTLPIDIYGHVLSLRYDQSVQTWASWLWDWMKIQLLGCFIASFLVWILYGIIRRSPARWWFYFWIASVPILVFVLFISPVVIDPLFFKFEPLQPKAPALVDSIEKVIHHGGLTIPRERMFLMNASEKVKSLNAYVTGIASSKRVVVWDTTIAKMTNDQTVYVFGHEMGHYVLHHVPKTIVFVAGLLLLFLFVGFLYMHSLINKYGIAWKIRSVEDYASLPVFILLLSIFSFIATPVISTYSRMQEHQADIYGLEVIHGIIPEPQKDAAEAFQILGEINLSDPNPNAFIKFWLYDHPALDDRLQFVRNYDPWSKGQPPKFVKE
jgi:Zn-dependent protease with chaperone function